MPRSHHLAQINIGRLRYAVDAAELADFVGNLDRINRLAEAQPGFVWRLTGTGNNALDVRAFEDDAIQLNMSVWTDIESLAAFVYRSAHRDFMRRRREWFEAMELFQALWWIPAGHFPSPAEGCARLDTLRRIGPGPDAFTFRSPFPSPGAEHAPDAILDRCA